MVHPELERDFLKNLNENQHILNKICFIYGSCKEGREDLRQEIVLQLWKSYASFAEKAKFSTWMYRVALNTALTYIKRRPVNILSNSLPDSIEDLESEKDFSEEIRLLYKAISHLNKIDKAIIFLWLEEYSYEEIANIIGTTVKNISVKLVRIKSKLGEIILKLQ